MSGLVRAIDANGDWVFGLGLQAYASGSAAVALDCQMSLLMVENDCFFAPTGWADWFNLLGTSNQAALLFSIQAVLLNVDGVNSATITSLNLDPSTRALSVSYEVTTVYGTSITDSIVFPVTPFTGVDKYVGDIFFNGDVTSVQVNVSEDIDDAQEAIWMVYDESNNYDQVVGAVQILSETTVQITIDPAPPAGNFRLVGIS
jgi:hypothetical protein